MPRGNNLEVRDDRTVRVGSTKYITEIINQYESQYGELRKNNVHAIPNDHPECDDSPPLNYEGIKRFQQMVGVCQWINIAGRYDINYGISSLRRFASGPREGH